MLIFLSFYLCSGSGSPQSAWSCYWSDSVWATSTVGLSAPRSSSADSGWFGSLKSEDFQNVCIFGRNFHNCRSKVEVERKTRELASVSLCQNVISTSPTGIWNNEQSHKHQHQQILVIRVIYYRYIFSFHLNFHFLLIIDLQFLHEAGEYFRGLDFKWFPLISLVRGLLSLLSLMRRTWLYLVFTGEKRLHLLQPLYDWVRFVNNWVGKVFIVLSTASRSYVGSQIDPSNDLVDL